MGRGENTGPVRGEGLGDGRGTEVDAPDMTKDSDRTVVLGGDLWT